MIFTSYQYLCFLLLVFVLHWVLSFRLQNLLLIVASYFFYCSWRPEYGLLLLGVTVFNWSYGRWVVAGREGGWILPVGILINLAPLIYFKYSNFLLTQAFSIGGFFGLSGHAPVLQVLLPLGISFFTFQGIAYLVDVASGEKPFEKLVDFTLYKALWPQLIAGPIIRPHEIRDQIENPRTLDYENVAEGCKRIIFGLFKKVVLADQLASTVDLVFTVNGNPAFLDAVTGICGFALQIYFDFSAYTDIAVGSARMFGFRFPENFSWPYLSRSPQEFWMRWHMSLSRWIRDYVFTPLMFAFRNHPKTQGLWLLVAMAICGLWHGANGTFLLWGIWHGLLLMLGQKLSGKVFLDSREHETAFYRGKSLMAWMITLVLVNLGWILFRSQSFAQAWEVTQALFTLRGGLRPAMIRENDVLIVASIAMLTGVVHLMWASVKSEYVKILERMPWVCLLKPVIYLLAIIAVVVFDREASTFVYFQF